MFTRITRETRQLHRAAIFDDFLAAEAGSHEGPLFRGSVIAAGEDQPDGEQADEDE